MALNQVANPARSSRVEVRFLLSPLEGGAQWCATGLENQASRKAEGSTPSLSAGGREGGGSSPLVCDALAIAHLHV